MRLLVLICVLAVAGRARGDDRTELANLVELGPNGLPAAFEGVTFGMAEVELGKVWKRYDRDLGGAQWGKVLAAPFSDDSRHVSRLVLYDNADEAVRLAILTNQ